MISDFHRTLLSRIVTKVSDSGGQFTETVADSTIYGYIAELSGQEILRARQFHAEAVCSLFTESDLHITDRVVDGTVEYEIVWEFTNFHRYYLLRRWK
jgi:hypothetical protein